MTRLRVNAPVQAAIETTERYAAIAGQLAIVEHDRTAALAATNAVADTLAAPLIAELDALRAELDPWWRRNGDALTAGKRRSAELGGCMLGLRAGRAKLTFAHGDDKAAVAALRPHRWAKPLIRVTTAVDKVAALKALVGKHATALAALGFGSDQGDDAFHIDRVDQAGVATPA